MLAIHKEEKLNFMDTIFVKKMYDESFEENAEN